MANIWIIGGGAIGQAVAQQKADLGHQVILFSTKPTSAVQPLQSVLLTDWDWNTLVNAAAQAPLPSEVVVATGQLWSETLSPEKRIEQLNSASLLQAFCANMMISAALLAHLSGRMQRDSKIKFLAISAKVGSISDNQLGGWYAYRCSKAALNMLIKTTAIEWQRRFPESALAVYHPGTTDSSLSEPFQARLADGQLKTPEAAANCLINVLDNHLQPETSGRFWHWDATELPW